MQRQFHDRYGDDFDVLFGPAYKGIPLAVVTAIAFNELYGKESVIVQTERRKGPWCRQRKLPW